MHFKVTGIYSIKAGYWKQIQTQFQRDGTLPMRQLRPVHSDKAQKGPLLRLSINLRLDFPAERRQRPLGKEFN